MMLEIQILTLGPVETNTYIVADTQTGDGVVIDPAWDGDVIARAVQDRGWQIRQVWLTHAHFDHMAGIAELLKELKDFPPIALHPADQRLYEMQGGAAMFGFQIMPGPAPQILLGDRTMLEIGMTQIQVRHTPGHTAGHVVFYSLQDNLVFCGDLIFAGGIGRTDLPGGNFNQLMRSIHSEILTLPGETRLLSGHGPETTVADEQQDNPFLTTINFK
jgi:hydroxyacylglutathione hydrolase